MMDDLGILPNGVSVEETIQLLHIPKNQAKSSSILGIIGSAGIGVIRPIHPAILPKVIVFWAYSVGATFSMGLNGFSTVLGPQFGFALFFIGLIVSIGVTGVFFGFTKLDLPKASSNDSAREYLIKRKLNPNKFYYASKFKEWTNSLLHTFDDVAYDEPRIIIPLYYKNQLVGFQGRSLGSNKIKYITVMLDENAPKFMVSMKPGPGSPFFQAIWVIRSNTSEAGLRSVTTTLQTTYFIGRSSCCISLVGRSRPNQHQRGVGKQQPGYSAPADRRGRTPTACESPADHHLDAAEAC
jgi:hypothetical protein